MTKKTSLSEERYFDGDWMVYPETKLKKAIKRLKEDIFKTDTVQQIVRKIDKIFGEFK